MGWIFRKHLSVKARHEIFGSDRALGRFNALLLGFLVILMAGCQQTTPLRPNIGPATTFNSHVLFGTPLSGRRKSVGLLNDAPGFIVHAQFWQLYYFPHVALPALAAQSTLMINKASPHPTMAYPALSAGARFGIVKNRPAFQAILHAPAVKAVSCGQATAALWPGMSVAMRLTDSSGLPINGSVLRQRVALWVWQPKAVPGKVGIAFEFKRLSATAAVPTLLGQLQILRTRKLAIATTYGAIMPFRFLNGDSQAVAMLITISPWTDTPANQLAAKYSRQSVMTTRNFHSPKERLNRPDLIAAIHNIGKLGVRRASLVYLAGQTGAHLTQDVAAVAQTPVLGALVKAVAAHTTHAQTMRVTTLGWVLDKTTYRLLYDIQKTKHLPEQLRIAMALHLGEAAWHASSLDEIARNLDSRRDYRLRVIKENLIYLEDTSPADRLTAYDWLQTHHLAPPNYNPLAGNQARNTALEKAENNPAYMRRIQQ